uniref:Uncharacterized protein n=1 Tax=Arundo donax TaxID=35708 RepID=A0A0A8YXK5_ARUDO
MVVLLFNYPPSSLAICSIICDDLDYIFGSNFFNHGHQLFSNVFLLLNLSFRVNCF